MLKHSLLLVVWNDYSSSRATALSVDHAMPGGLVVRAVHYKAYCSGCVAVAENLSELTVRHNAPVRNFSN